MSGSTFTFVGTTGVSSDWNTAANWSPATIPNSPTAVAIDNDPVDNVISGGAADTVGTLSIGGGFVFVGGSAVFGGTGDGALTADTIVQNGGVLVSVAGSTITATSITGIDVGGGGTFNAPIDDSGGNVVANNADYDLGPLILNGGGITGSGGIEITSGSTLELNEPTVQSVTITPGVSVGATTPAVLHLDQPASFTGGIDIGSGLSIDLLFAGSAISSATINAGDTLLVTQGGTTDSIPLSGAGLAIGTNVFVDNVVCFARGTRIATPSGEVAIERLKPGDLVLTAAGKSKPVVWVGRRRADCRRHPAPHKVWPVRIRAGAFGPGLPARDLRVSPQHGIYAEGVLIPAKRLINGTSVTQERVAKIEYFHVELDRHDLLLAEGLLAESYLDTGDRASFENGGGAVILHPDFSSWVWDARACADLKVVGPEVDRVKAQLAQRARHVASAPAVAPAAV